MFCTSFRKLRGIYCGFEVNGYKYFSLIIFLGPRSLEGKVAIVTGASSGIGESVARTLAEHGAKVVLAARRKERYLIEQLGKNTRMPGERALGWS